MRVSLRFTTATFCALLALLVTAEAVNTSRPQADSFAKKLAIIKQHAADSPKSGRRTTVTEGELNSWFVYRAPALLPAGVKAPQVTAVGNGKMLGVVTVDLDDIAKSRSGLWKLWRHHADLVERRAAHERRDAERSTCSPRKSPACRCRSSWSRKS